MVLPQSCTYHKPSLSEALFVSHNSKEIRTAMDFNRKGLSLVKRILAETVINLRTVSRIVFGHVFMSVTSWDLEVRMNYEGFPKYRHAYRKLYKLQNSKTEIHEQAAERHLCACAWFIH